MRRVDAPRRDKRRRAAATSPLPPELSVRRLVRRALQIGVVAVAVIVALSTLPGLDEVRERVAGARPGWLLAALALKLASLLAFVVAFRGVYCPRMGWRLSFQIATAEQAANVLLPAGGAGGLALGAWALQRGGMETGHIARRTVAFFLITSLVNFSAIVLAGSALALGVGGSTGRALALVPAAVAAAVVVAVALLPRFLRRGPVSRKRARVLRAVTAGRAMLADGIDDAAALLRVLDPLVIAGAVGYMAFDVGALAAAFEAFGTVPAPGVLVLAYAVGQLGGLIPIPGGIGGVDGGLIAAFVVYGTSAPLATAAVLAYRVVQVGLPAAAGTAGFARLQRTLASSSDPAALCAPMAAGSLR